MGTQYVVRFKNGFSKLIVKLKFVVNSGIFWNYNNLFFLVLQLVAHPPQIIFSKNLNIKNIPLSTANYFKYIRVVK